MCMSRILCNSLLLGMVLSCGPSRDPNQVIVSLTADIATLNPLTAVGTSAGTITPFLFPSLVQIEFDSAQGRAIYKPFLASRWVSDSMTVTFVLRKCFWEDARPITPGDVRYSYRTYAHPDLASPRRAGLTLLALDEKGLPRLETPTDSTVVFHFQRSAPLSVRLNLANLEIVPSHMLGNLTIKEIPSSAFSLRPTTGRHYRFFNREPGQSVVLTKNEQWTFPTETIIPHVIFRILPDANTRLVELKQGRIDVAEGLSVDDAKFLSEESHIRIETQPQRRYDYIGWMNIDVAEYQKTKKRQPHPIFGDPRVRKALTMAIHRQDIVEQHLGSYGRGAFGPVSPAFRWAYHDSLQPWPYDPDEAKRLLRDAGWSDHDGDGVLDRDGKAFEFELVTNAGNARREAIIEAVASDLQKIGIRCTPRKMEANAFHAGLRTRSYDAFLTGFQVAAGADLTAQFGSDISRNVFNVQAYTSEAVDSLLSEAYWDETGRSLKRLQEVLHEDQPVTFLYWFDNLVAVHNRLQGTTVDFISAFQALERWNIVD